MDPFTVAYLSGAAALVAAEFTAIFRRKPGDTITEKTKASPVLHSVMSSLLVWGAWHFAGNDITGHDAPATNVAIAIAGGVAGAVAHAKRSATDRS